jgi:hypothetical protein
MTEDQSMPPTDDLEQEPYYIFTHEEADRLLTEALDTSLDEPEPFVRLLLILHDHASERQLKDSIYLLMEVAYEGSIVRSINFDEYLEAIRQERDVLKEARTRWYGDHGSEA